MSNLIIPNSVTTIGDRAFAGCSNLETVTIGNGITSIEEYAFSGCTKLKDFYCYAKNVPSTKSTTFISCFLNNVTLHVPYESVNSYKSTAPWKDFKIILGLATTDINDVSIDSRNVLIYSIDGKKLYSPQKGLNIVYMSDGSIKKVVMK